MRAPLRWLADFVAIDMPTDELAHRLTMSGLKVESIDRMGDDWRDVHIGKVIELTPHPRSNKPLWVARVDLGDRQVTIVTGAQNVRLGDAVPVVLVGGLLPHGPDGGSMRIERKPMAGIDSDGMLASQRELGISDEHSGIFRLPPDAPVGALLTSIMGGDVLDIETNPNRPDTLSMIGIAREVAALSGQELSLPDLDTIGPNVVQLDEDSIPIGIENADLCPRYSALRISGLEERASPFWLADRLLAAGMRPINLLVDLTNYVMLEYGQPMHAFDAARLEGGRIMVRRAKDGERLTTLDGVERTLSRHDLVIADDHRPVGIAGVMGGENSEIRGDTSSLVLESANFDPVSVRRTAQSLNLRTEASTRFEKGLAPEQTVLGLRRFVQLLAQTAGTQVSVARISDAWAGAQPPRVVAMPMRDVHRLVGMPISLGEAQNALSLLGFGVRSEGEEIIAEVPYWRRSDIELSADLVEEVARIVGFEKIPATLPLRTMPADPLPAPLRWEDRIRETLLANGASEVTTHSLTSASEQFRLLQDGGSGPIDEESWSTLAINQAGIRAERAQAQPVRLLNPATLERQILRVSIVPGVLDVVARNAKHSDERLAFFEMGHTFFHRPDAGKLPYERRTLAVAMAGFRHPPSWADQRPGPYTFFDLKGVIEACLEALHVAGWRVEPCSHPALHPGRSGALMLAEGNVGYMGELHPLVADRFELGGQRVQVAELDLDAIFKQASDIPPYLPSSRFPAALRDLAVVVGTDVPAGQVLDVVRSSGGELLESARIFDVYSGDQLIAGTKSIAISMSFRAASATLTQNEVGSVWDGIVDALKNELGATVRD